MKHRSRRRTSRRPCRPGYRLRWRPCPPLPPLRRPGSRLRHLRPLQRRLPSPTSTPSPTPTLTPTLTPTPTVTPTHTPTPTFTPAPTPTSTPIPTPTQVASLSIADVVENTRDGVVRVVGPAGAGSGFVVDADGYILTNDHVIAGPGQLTVFFDHGARLTPQVIASDPARDIALLKVESSPPAQGPAPRDRGEGGRRGRGDRLSPRPGGRDERHPGHSLRLPVLRGRGLCPDRRRHQQRQQRRTALEPQGRGRRNEQPRAPRCRGDRVRNQV